ncbi:rRNA adenine N-6-methyltransferase family protein [Streptomyces zagrosensis]|uniref:Protein-L-isoaspartate O-methyltransferase n=1 Tax=Streptomyces zagrosensis TaxID=1042984 RepID=A0A7W9QHD4_9ACTN|nr:rRNA adenine N-6-methyltransferase family protein [Streptomyces zagrosensis]MBB5940315.1 protein-L-isoaspartate(D-aspartate) O-methyltransferase [Streptomyces zagrosensis]
MSTDPGYWRGECARSIDTYAPGYFHHRPWLREVFLATPREQFVPDLVWWPDARGDGLYPQLDRTVRPRQWLEAVYRPLAALITQMDDGQTPPENGSASGTFTSSISCPSIVVDMLHHLDPQPGENVLEIGAGTGYSAALLARRLGPRRLVTMEIDAALAQEAAQRLLRLDPALEVLVVTGAGELGYPLRAPYDRIVSTAAVRTIPPAWLCQVRHGGTILTPIDTPYGHDALLTLTCDGAGSATGHLIKPVAFMKLRGQRHQPPWENLGWPKELPVADAPPWKHHRVTADPAGQRIYLHRAQ